jgi:TIR domain
MRMLRLGVGWSADRLSQEYRTCGAGELARTTIAKIERDIRSIKVGELDGVARIFGLTSDDLVDPDGPKVFLSYAEQDDSTGQGVAAWLGDHGFQLFSVGSTAADDPGSGPADARAIDAAQAFVALLSPSFLSSPRCQQELDLAVRRERQLLAADPATHFIYVLQVTAEANLDNSGLISHLLIDLPAGSDRSRDMALSKLGGSILSGARAPEGSGRSANSPPLPSQPGKPDSWRGTWARAECTE